MEPTNQQDMGDERSVSRPERRMNRRAVLLTVLLFALVVAGMFAFAFLKHDDAKKQDTMSDTNAADARYANITRVDGKHFFIDGVHTVVGEIPMPTPCDLLESDARVAESAPEQVTIDFTVVNNAEFCAEQITPQRFKVSANASENASFSATFEGRPIELNLVEAGPDESPDDFELFIKG